MFLYYVYFAYICPIVMNQSFIYIELNSFRACCRCAIRLYTLIMIDLQCKTGDSRERIGTNKYSVNIQISIHVYYESYTEKYNLSLFICANKNIGVKYIFFCSCIGNWIQTSELHQSNPRTALYLWGKKFNELSRNFCATLCIGRYKSFNSR